MAPAIHAVDISKSYRMGQGEMYRTFRDALVNTARLPAKYLAGRSGAQDQNLFWALKGVSFDVDEGEVLGIIGRNGAGKSTLLKILSRITSPTGGYAEIHGRVGSLLEVGTGFHWELTGRENIYLSGAILGMSKAEIDSKFDEIVKFAEVEKFIDTPLKHYSSGMNLRLGFAVAANLDTEILIVDEVLAVGDAAFQKKCMGKMDDVAKHEGRTVLFVSHNMTSILGLCNRAILVDRGNIIMDGEAQQVVNHYLKSTYETTVKMELKDRTDRSGDGSIRATHIQFGTQSNRDGGYWVTGENAFAELDYECRGGKKYKNIEVALCIHRMDQSKFLYLGTKILRMDIPEIEGKGRFVCEISRLPVEPGRYVVHTEFKQNGVIVDYLDSAALIDVMDGDFYGTGTIWPYGGYLCDYRWSFLPGGKN